MNFTELRPSKGRVYIETYGCQMNVGDTEIVASILRADNWEIVKTLAEATVALVNTCAIREGAEQKIYGRLLEWRAAKRLQKGLIVGVIGCMAERLKETLFEEGRADLVAGPDVYRTLPQLIERAQTGEKAIDIALSTRETYEEIEPVRLETNGVSAFVSIMRGCNNFCAYCVVPYTRGRERSRPHATILNEVGDLLAKGYREVTLLGQNVNSYNDGGVDFADLLSAVATLSPQLRVRFSTSHPKDFSDRVIEAMRAHGNIARSIHLPAQSGSSEVLRRMKRGYTREWYLERIAAIRRGLPDCTITTDLIAGFSGETPEDHAQTLSLMREVGYSFAFMFAYSERPGTFAAGNLKDDIEQKEKINRLEQIIELQNSLSLQNNKACVGGVFEVLVEGVSKRSERQLFGRTSQNKVAVFDRVGDVEIGDYVKVRVAQASSATLITKIITLSLLREEIKAWAQSTLTTRTTERPDFDKPIRYTSTGIKEAINQPHNQPFHKLLAIKQIEALITNAEYICKSIDHKGRAKYFHYLEVKINNATSFICIKESYENQYSFYTIVDRIKKEPEDINPKTL